MFETLISLFERLVVAHEKLAASQEAMMQEAFKPMGDPTPVEDKPKTTRNGKKAEPKPEAAKVEPAPESPKPEPEKPKLTLADVKKAVAEYAQARMTAGSPDPKGNARALMAQHADGAAKTDDIKELYFESVVNACVAGWVPMAEEEL